MANKAFEEVRVGNTIIYNDGRPGHSGIIGKVTEVFPGGMVVQFEDRAEPNRIYFHDEDWMRFLHIRGQS